MAVTTVAVSKSAAASTAPVRLLLAGGVGTLMYVAGVWLFSGRPRGLAALAALERDPVVSTDRAETPGVDGRLTTRTYWDHSWRGASAGRRRVKRLRRLEALDWQFGQLLLRAVDRAKQDDRPVRVLEIGCANSIWLPFLAREAHADVAGVDFSERGCDLARQNLAAEGCGGSIVCADFFDTASAPWHRSIW